MFEKLIGVSPPQKGKAQESKQVDDKNLRGSSRSAYKKDFEKALEKKIAEKKEKLEAKKEDSQRSEEPKLAETKEGKRDKKQIKSLGGNKKKVTDDDKMVSNITASNESKVETPEVKKENPAKIEVEVSQKVEKTDQQSELIGAMALQQAPVVQTPAIKTENSSSVAATATKIAELSEQNQIMNPAEMFSEMPAVKGKAAELGEMAELKANSLTDQVANSKAAIQTADSSLELSKSVGFKTDSNLQEASEKLVEKLKAFDVERPQMPNKIQSFEKDVLSQLQKEQSYAPVHSQAILPKSDMDKGESSSFGQKENEKNTDLKSDLIGQHALHQAAGQSHSEFKLNTEISAAHNSTSLAKLEENREANINEIMNQAQYLVKKGGGEVSVKMSPEGMGEVHLKVILNDGKLNVEMQTQDQNVKKLIEESLSDLKSGLAAHRLSLEHVKIDSVSATNADNNTQFQSNLNHGGNEQRARDLWQQQDSNSNLNQQGRRSQHNEAAFQPDVPKSIRSGVSAAQALRTYGGTKGAGLNRVA